MLNDKTKDQRPKTGDRRPETEDRRLQTADRRRAGAAEGGPAGPSLLLFDLVALLLQHGEQAVGTDEVGGADDDEAGG